MSWGGEAALGTPGRTSRARSGSGPGCPKPGFEPSSPLSNYVTLGNYSPLWRLRFLFRPAGMELLPRRVVVKQPCNKCGCTDRSRLAWPWLRPDSAGRWFGSQQTCDGCPDFPDHSFISPNVEEAARGQLFWAQSWPRGESGLVLWNGYIGLSSSQSLSHASFHLVLQTTQQRN